MKFFCCPKISSAVKGGITSFFFWWFYISNNDNNDTHHPPPPTVVTITLPSFRRLKDLGPHPEGPSSQEPEGMGVAYAPWEERDFPQIFSPKRNPTISEIPKQKRFGDRSEYLPGGYVGEILDSTCSIMHSILPFCWQSSSTGMRGIFGDLKMGPSDVGIPAVSMSSSSNWR